MATTWQVGFSALFMFIRMSFGERAEKRSMTLMASTVSKDHKKARTIGKTTDKFITCWIMVAGDNLAQLKICGQNNQAAGYYSWTWNQMKALFPNNIVTDQTPAHWVSLEETEAYTAQQDTAGTLTVKQKAEKRVRQAHDQTFTTLRIPVGNYKAPTLAQLQQLHTAIRNAPNDAWVINDAGGEGRLGMFLMAEQGFRTPPAQTAFGQWVTNIRHEVVGTENSGRFNRCDPGEFYHNKDERKATQKKQYAGAVRPLELPKKQSTTTDTVQRYD